MSLLDEIVFSSSPMAPLPPVPKPAKTSFSLGGKENLRPLQIGGPWMVCNTSPSQAAAKWSDLCTRLSDRGLLLECPVNALEKLPVASIPRRLFRQSVGTSLILEELQSADIVEVTCQHKESGSWGWPPEVDSTASMQDWLASVRHVIGKNTPFGIGVKSGIDQASIEAICNWPIDFVSLRDDGPIELFVDSITRMRIHFHERSKDKPILVRTSNKRADHLLKILSLGASAVTIDGLLADLWQSPSSSPSQGGFFGSQISSSTQAKKTCQVQETLDSLSVKLQEAMRNSGCETLKDLTSSLRALTPTAARLTQIPLLSQ
jgi:hypothetical protein